MDDLPGDFHEISPADTNALFHTFDRAGKRAWCYYAPFLTCYHLPPGRCVLVGRYEDAQFLLARTDRKQTIYNLIVPPIPFDTQAAVGLMDTLQESTGVMPRVLWADAEDAELATRVGFTAEEKEQEYYYDPGLVAALEGSGYKELRKRIRRTERRYSPEFREMISDDIPDCHVLLKQWRRLQGRKHSFLLDWGYTHAALDRFGDWDVQDLVGWCIHVEGRLSAFAMAGRMASDQACFFVAKSDPELPGISDFLRHRVYTALAGYRRVNDAGDLDLPGLRQHKRRFRPVEMQPVYSLQR